MTMSQLLPWFPIILAVGVGGRLLGRTRGLFMGILCAMFWVMLVQAATGTEVWQDPWSAAAMVAGCVAIGAMGRWSGGSEEETAPLVAAAKASGKTSSADKDVEHEPSLLRISSALDQFDDWLEQHRDSSDPWPKFGEFVRTALYQSCNATHVRPYRLSGEGEQLVPLRELDPLSDDGRVSARRGIIGHVMTTGRSFMADDQSQGELVGRLAAESSESVTWCFAIRQGTERLGAVTVGQLGLSPSCHRTFLHAMEQLVNRFWCHVVEVLQSRSAVQFDVPSGLYVRSAFLRTAEDSMRESYAQGEPVAVVVIALEGLREINDSGRWEAADELIREVGDALRCKVRTDDRLGRFDGSRLILLLRRVDSELASLIVTQIMSRLTTLCADESRCGVAVTVRCGVAGSGTERVDLRTLIARALVQCRRARLSDRSISSDLASEGCETEQLAEQTAE